MNGKILSIGQSADYAIATYGVGTTDPPKLIPTGIKAFDAVIGGLGLGTCNVYGGATGTGKSSLALLCAIQQARLGYRPAILSLEDTADIYGVRAISDLTGIDSRRIRTKHLTPREQEIVKRAAAELHSVQINVAYAVSSGIERIKDAARRLVSDGASLLYVDYIQKPAVAESRRTEIDRYVTELHEISADANIPIVFLSQLRRPQAQQGKHVDTRPNRYWLKESGGLENNARFIVLIHPENGNLNCWIEKCNYGGEHTSVTLTRGESGTLREWRGQ